MPYEILNLDNYIHLCQWQNNSLYLHKTRCGYNSEK